MNNRKGMHTIIVNDSEFNMRTATEWAEKFRQQQEQGRNHIIIDLQPVDIIDSYGIGQLVNLRRRCQVAGGDIVIMIGENRGVGNILKQSRVPLEVVHTIEEANGFFLDFG